MELPKINERHKTKFRIAKRIPAAPALFCPSSRNPLFNAVLNDRAVHTVLMRGVSRGRFR